MMADHADIDGETAISILSLLHGVTMKPSSISPACVLTAVPAASAAATPANTTDSGRIRLGGGFRLPQRPSKL